MPDSTQIDPSWYPEAELADTSAAAPAPAAASSAAASPADLQAGVVAALQVMRGRHNVMCCHATIQWRYA